ncbi:hypothetical protein G7Z17_g1407 [Cylindrodendrum hubeiense]|uniref:Carboxylic ester hydrolase n=1 Tax=Cylindrodendrum hubeiense TaxID=595255 RepID=A0A9P5HEV6_9HYPO|nr:hypothetical protein G7Z17_g1407 [Cylindrodendrum hubeiense]
MLGAVAVGVASACSSSTFTPPDLFGSDILSISANLVLNYTATAPYQTTVHHPTIDVHDAEFCNVTVAYTHPGQDDYINVEIWLPIGNWNERLMAVGGGGYVAGRFSYSETMMVAALGLGYATVTTDAGLGTAFYPEEWALLSPGNVNLYALQNLASTSLNDEAVIAKSVIKQFYDKTQKYSYWSGCSQGGRQGLKLAQQFPDAYDGIAASAPALNWPKIFPSFFWPQVIMNELEKYPAPCEFAHLAKAAVSACDARDGVVDEVISNLDDCHFDPFDSAGDIFNCSDTGKTTTLSAAAAIVANATWEGARTSDGRFLWYGNGYGSDFQSSQGAGIAATDCTNGTCVGAPTPLGTQWIQMFVEKNKSFDYNSISRLDFERIFHASVAQYTSMMSTNDPDLSAFRDAGGKLMMFHGTNDQLIPYKGSDDYYESVASQMHDIDDFYRYFHVPGLGHCSGGSDASPTTAMKQLRAWVEEGKKPDTVPVKIKDSHGRKFDRPLCPYPKKTHFDGGDPTRLESFSCRK